MMTEVLTLFDRIELLKASCFFVPFFPLSSTFQKLTWLGSEGVGVG